MKPVVLMVGADKGGVGKTTVTRTVLDYLAAKNALVRAFDAEHPRGTLQRFHPDITEVVDITTAADQMKMIDTLATSEIKVSVIDIRAGLLDETLKTLTLMLCGTSERLVNHSPSAQLCSTALAWALPLSAFSLTSWNWSNISSVFFRPSAATWPTSGSSSRSINGLML